MEDISMRRFLGELIGLAATTIVLSCLMTSFATTAGAQDRIVHACIQHSSLQVRIVEANDPCRDSEQRLQWNLMGLQGEPGPPGPRGPQGERGPAGEPGSGLQLVDSLGMAIGKLLGCCDVVIDAGGTKVLLPVASGGFQQTNVFFYYESADCTGPRLLPESGVFSRTLVQGTTAYYATDFGMHAVQSQESQGMCFATSFSRPTGPVSTLDVSSFIPPFSVK
jgi:hypothetical protein